jgi:hypothetical protein
MRRGVVGIDWLDGSDFELRQPPRFAFACC